MKIEYLLQCRWMKTNLKNRVFLFFLWNIYIRSRLAEIRTTFPNENKTKMINFLEVFQSINEIFSENIDLDEKFQIKIVIRDRTINFKKSALKRLSWPLKTFLGRNMLITVIYDFDSFEISKFFFDSLKFSSHFTQVCFLIKKILQYLLTVKTYLNYLFSHGSP